MIGLKPEEIVESRQGSCNETKPNALLNFVQRVIETQGHVDDSDIANVRESGYSDIAIAEIVTHIALNTLTNYFNSVNQTEVDFPQVESLLT